MTTWILACVACAAVFGFGLYLSRKPKQKQQ